MGYGSKENIKPYSTFEFDAQGLKIWDNKKENVETLQYQNNTTVNEPYTMILDLADFKIVLDGCSEDYITLTFGNNQAAVIVRNNIYNVIPEAINDFIPDFKLRFNQLLEPAPISLFF